MVCLHIFNELQESMVVLRDIYSLSTHNSQLFKTQNTSHFNYSGSVGHIRHLHWCRLPLTRQDNLKVYEQKMQCLYIFQLK